MIKQLLVGLGSSEYAGSAVLYGCDLAKRHGARLVGLAVANTAEVEAAYRTPRPLGAGSADQEVYKQRLAEARDAAKENLAGFEEVCKKEGVDYSGQIVEGDPSEEILKASILSDLVILGRKTRFTCWLPDDEFDDTCSEVIEKSTHPMILTPGERSDVKKVLIALDFQRLSDRVYFNFIHLNPFPEAEAHLVHAAKGKADSEFPEHLVEYFATHGVKAKPVMLTGDHVGQAIVNYAGAEGMDMVVMGVHTMSKVLKALLGSTGRYVLNHCDLPIYTQT